MRLDLRTICAAVALMAIVAGCRSVDAGARAAGYAGVAAASMGLGEQQPYRGSDRVRVDRYGITMTLPALDANSLDVVEDVSFTPLVALAGIELHVEPVTTTISAVSSGDTDLAYQVVPGIAGDRGLSGQVLRIEMPSLVANAPASVRLTYTVKLGGSEHGLKRRVFNGSAVVNATNWPYFTRFWLPSVDSPENPAAVSFEFHVPQDTVAAANGRLVEGDYQSGSGLDANGLRVFKWVEDDPIPTYGFNPVIGVLRSQTDEVCFDPAEISPDLRACGADVAHIPIVFFDQPSSSRPPRSALPAEIGKAMRAAAFFSAALGLYPYPKIGYVLAPQDFFMEYPSLITLPSMGATVHELLHHWWGDTVRIRTWGDFWISEGFTTYFTGFFDEVLTGTNSAALCPNAAAALNHGADTDPLSIFDQTPYCKGAAAVGALREAIAQLAALAPRSSDERAVFLGVMKGLFARHRFAALGTQDLVDDLRAHLRDDLGELGHPVDQAAVAAALDAWKAAFFVGIQ